MKKKAKLGDKFVGDKFVVIGNSGGDHSFSKYDIVTLSGGQCDGIHMYVDCGDMFGFVPDADLVPLKTVKKLGMKYLSKHAEIENYFTPKMGKTYYVITGGCGIPFGTKVVRKNKHDTGPYDMWSSKGQEYYVFSNLLATKKQIIEAGIKVLKERAAGKV